MKTLRAGSASDEFGAEGTVPEGYLDRIFDLGVSGSEQASNSGLGLFASRIYGLAMRLTLRAENRANGVALVLEFPAPSFSTT